MARPEVLRLPQSSGFDWIVGIEPAIKKSSAFYSERIQIFHANSPNVKALLDREKYHRHAPVSLLEKIVSFFTHGKSSEEYYLVLNGELKVKVGNRPVFVLRPKEILPVPPDECHMVVDASPDVQYLTIRAPVSAKKHLCRDVPAT